MSNFSDVLILSVEKCLPLIGMAMMLPQSGMAIMIKAFAHHSTLHTYRITNTRGVRYKILLPLSCTLSLQ
jgi:hypothetical protein